MTMVRHMSTAAALALHVACIGIAMSMPSSAPPVEAREIPITLTLAPPPPPPPPAPKVEEPRPEPKPVPKAVVNDTPPPPPVPQPMLDPPPEVIASAATSVAESIVPVAPPPPPPPPNPGAAKAKDDYFGRVLGWLERHKRTPRTSRIQATAWVEFAFDRSGRLVNSKLFKSSGVAVLDEAAMKMVERSSPFPAVPKEVPGETISLQVPVEFTIR